MICPYNLRAKTDVQQWEQTPDDNQILTSGTTVTKVIYRYMECKQHECGAFYNGRCYYSNNERN